MTVCAAGHNRCKRAQSHASDGIAKSYKVPDDFHHMGDSYRFACFSAGIWQDAHVFPSLLGSSIIIAENPGVSGSKIDHNTKLLYKKMNVFTFEKQMLNL